MFARRSLQLAVVMGALSFVSTAGAAPAGTLIVADHEVTYNAKTFDKDVKKASKDTLSKGVDGWTMYVIAYLKKEAGADEVNLVFYDPGSKDKEPVNAFPITTRANAKILMTSVTVSPEQGLKAGTKYLVEITRLIGGREEVYAKTMLTLK